MSIVVFCINDHPGMRDVIRAIKQVDPEWGVKLNPSESWVDSCHDDIALVISIFNITLLSGKILRKPNFNVHVSPPWYRGIGGPAFAVLEGRDLHGVLAHEMDEVLDHGRIIRTQTFNIEGMTYDQVVKKTHHACVELLKSLLEDFKKHGEIRFQENAQWEGALRTKEDLLETLKNSPSSYSDDILEHYSKYFRSFRRTS